MSKTTRTLLLVAALAAAGFLVWKYMRNRQQQNTGTGTLGTNLNSVAPELIGGSTGPSLGPAVNLPINITLTDTGAMTSQAANPYGMQTATSAVPEMNNASTAQPVGVSMRPANTTTTIPFGSQGDASQETPQGGWHA